MVKAVWNGLVIAESDNTVMVEGNHYFPPSSLNKEYLEEVPRYTTACPWKGTASYYNVTDKNSDQSLVKAAWTYKKPKAAAASITDHVAFWKGRGVEVIS